MATVCLPSSARSPAASYTWLNSCPLSAMPVMRFPHSIVSGVVERSRRVSTEESIFHFLQIKLWLRAFDFLLGTYSPSAHLKHEITFSIISIVLNRYKYKKQPKGCFLSLLLLPLTHSKSTPCIYAQINI